MIHVVYPWFLFVVSIRDPLFPRWEKPVALQCGHIFCTTSSTNGRRHRLKYSSAVGDSPSSIWDAAVIVDKHSTVSRGSSSSSMKGLHDKGIWLFAARYPLSRELKSGNLLTVGESSGHGCRCPFHQTWISRHSVQDPGNYTRGVYRRNRFKDRTLV